MNGDLNPYYCPKFLVVFSLNYLNVLPLWAPLFTANRFSNSLAKCHFCHTKQCGVIDCITKLGNPPYRAARFLEEKMREQRKPKEKAFLNQIPKKRMVIK